MEDFAHAMADFVREHQAWAAPIVLVLAFGESLAFISLLIPAWGALVAIGALIGASGISFWPVWIAGGIGAALGDWVSYWFGYKYKEQVAQMWPLSRDPEILPRGEAFVKSWGVPSIFLGRFFGPLRASVPLAPAPSPEPPPPRPHRGSRRSGQAPPHRWPTSRRRASIATRSATSRSRWCPTAGTPSSWRIPSSPMRRRKRSTPCSRRRSCRVTCSRSTSRRW